MTYEEIQNLGNLPDNAGFKTLVKMLTSRYNVVTNALGMPKSSKDDDIRTLEYWRGLRDILGLLSDIPKVIEAELDALTTIERMDLDNGMSKRTVIHMPGEKDNIN